MTTPSQTGNKVVFNQTVEERFDMLHWFKSNVEKCEEEGKDVSMMTTIFQTALKASFEQKEYPAASDEADKDEDEEKPKRMCTVL